MEILGIQVRNFVANARWGLARAQSQIAVHRAHDDKMWGIPILMAHIGVPLFMEANIILGVYRGYYGVLYGI